MDYGNTSDSCNHGGDHGNCRLRFMASIGTHFLSHGFEFPAVFGYVREHATRGQQKPGVRISSQTACECCEFWWLLIEFAINHVFSLLSHVFEGQSSVEGILAQFLDETDPLREARCAI